jgi:putative transposase
MASNVRTYTRAPQCTHWDHDPVIVSLLYQLTRRLLSVPAVLLRRDVDKDAELLVLRYENTVLRRQIAGKVRYEPADLLWFAALSSLLLRRRWHAIFPVQPATILAWHRKFIAWKWDYSTSLPPCYAPRPQ